MKFIVCLVILLLSSLTYASEEKFICSDIDSAGFNYDGNNYKITLFNLQTFEIIIDINNRLLDAPDLMMPKGDSLEGICLDNSNNLALLTCTNVYGQTFMFNTINYEFSYSSIYGHVGDDPDSTGYADSLGVRFGVCKKL